MCAADGPVHKSAEADETAVPFNETADCVKTNVEAENVEADTEADNAESDVEAEPW